MKMFIFLIVVLPSLYLAYLVFKGWSTIRTAPREDMFLCPKGHGPMSKSVLINFMGEDFCPICFHEKLKAAERGSL